MRKVLVGGVVCLLGVINAHGEVGNGSSHRVAFGGLHGALRWSQAPIDLEDPIDEASGSLRGVGGGVHFGYGWARNNIYVGGEISYTQGGLSKVQNVKDSSYLSGSVSEVTYDHQVAFDVHVGNGTPQLCFFSIIGFAGIQESINLKKMNSGYGMRDQSMKPHFLWGPHLGVGSHIEVADNLMVSLSLNYSLYFDVWSGRSGTVDMRGGDTLDFKTFKRYVGRNDLMQAEAFVGVSYTLPVRL